jgi:hypothetical protein
VLETSESIKKSVNETAQNFTLGHSLKGEKGVKNLLLTTN